MVVRGKLETEGERGREKDSTVRSETDRQRQANRDRYGND